MAAKGGPLKIDFNPRAPCGARRVAEIATHLGKSNFNPRAPCGARRMTCARQACTTLFQPTRPLRGATQGHQNGQVCHEISTHAPLAGRDRTVLGTTLPRCEFQPTRPLRGATQYGKPVPAGQRFQPTRPLRGATYPLRGASGLWSISTHAPLAGRDKRLL